MDLSMLAELKLNNVSLGKVFVSFMKGGLLQIDKFVVVKLESAAEENMNRRFRDGPLETRG